MTFLHGLSLRFRWRFHRIKAFVHWKILYPLACWFWRLALPVVEWWRARAADKRRWDCRDGHLKLVRVVIPVALYSPKRTAIIERKIGCEWCGATTHKTWKGRMTDEAKQQLWNLARGVTCEEKARM